MKKSIISAFFLMVSSYAFSQKTAKDPFNGATRIIVTNNNSIAENYSLVGQLFIEKGFFIGKKDVEFKVIQTEPIFVKAPGYVLYSQTIYAVIKEKEIVLLTKGRYPNGGEFTPAAKTVTALDFLSWQKKGDVEQSCFKNMVSIAEKIPNSIVEYSE